MAEARRFCPSAFDESESFDSHVNCRIIARLDYSLTALHPLQLVCAGNSRESNIFKVALMFVKLTGNTKNVAKTSTNYTRRIIYLNKNILSITLLEPRVLS